MGSPSVTKRKVRDLNQLAADLAELRSQGKKIVHCHGVFDLLHLGHIRHLESARKNGDVLVVTLTPDQWVNKGPHRPAFPHDYRAEALASLQCVDFVALNQWPTATETIRLLRPHFFAKGGEFRDRKDVTGAIPLEEEAIRSVGGEIVFTEDDVVFSSSTLINRHLPQVSREATEFLAEFATRRDIAEVMRYLDNARSLKVLVVGEAIIDEYHYCQTLGKSGKEPILAVRHSSSEKFAGGNLAVANHVASFTDRVDLLTCLGRENPQEDFIRSKLSPRVQAHFVYQEGAPTIVKERFIEQYPFQKMFEVYQMKEDHGDTASVEKFHATLRQLAPEHDLVIATDYGHGLLDETAIEILCREARCLAINTQTNAANHGYNTVSKYPRADYVCVSENELRLEARKRRESLQQIITAVATRMKCQRVMVTRGQQGVLCFGPEEGFVTAPALAGHFTDRVGAGDAVFAVTALCMAQKAPADILGLIGNAVGALAVTVVGNRTPIDRTGLVRTLISLFK